MQTVMGWAADLATMVAMLHALRVIHRDIKVRPQDLGDRREGVLIGPRSADSFS